MSEVAGSGQNILVPPEGGTGENPQAGGINLPPQPLDNGDQTQVMSQPVIKANKQVESETKKVLDKHRLGKVWGPLIRFCKLNGKTFQEQQEARESGIENNGSVDSLTKKEFKVIVEKRVRRARLAFGILAGMIMWVGPCDAYPINKLADKDQSVEVDNSPEHTPETTVNPDNAAGVSAQLEQKEKNSIAALSSSVEAQLESVQDSYLKKDRIGEAESNSRSAGSSVVSRDKSIKDADSSAQSSLDYRIASQNKSVEAAAKATIATNMPTTAATTVPTTTPTTIITSARNTDGTTTTIPAKLPTTLFDTREATANGIR